MYNAEDKGKKKQDYGPLSEYCRSIEAVVVFKKWTDPAFNICKAYNHAARHSCREAIAFFDSDVIFHPDTLKIAAQSLSEGKGAVVPVGRSKIKPTDKRLIKIKRENWYKFTKGLKHTRNGIGNIIVPRRVVEIIHGYDERFYGWGAADSDFHKRVKLRAGTDYLIDRRLPLALHMLHKQNPTKHSEYTTRNRKMWTQTPGKVRNKRHWGGEVSRERPVHKGYRLDFIGTEAQHSPYTYDLISSILRKNQTDQIVELGTAEGGLSIYFALWAHRLGIPFHTFDIKQHIDKKTLQVLNKLGGQFHLMDALSPKGVKFIRKTLKGKRSYLFCDNGDKPKEVELFLPFLKKGSVISVHDWLTEVHPSDVKDLVKNLKPFEEKRWAFENVFTATWIKV
jgi:cephalosporin hydroxylase